jgi:hypothetical protein
MKVCLTTICIGEKYLQEYNTLFRPSHEYYAKKHKYDFKVITDYISDIKHKDVISFNKALVCNYKWEKDYDFIIFIDADILINKKAPSLHDSYDFGDKIGVVNQSQPNLEARILAQKQKGYADISAKDYYRIKSGHEIDTDHIINTGVLVIQPAKHAVFLKNIFEKYYKTQIDNKSGFHYEQSVIGYELQSNNLHYFMDMKWNSLWGNNKYWFNMIGSPITLQTFYDNHYFIHLAGKCDFHLVPYILDE